MTARPTTIAAARETAFREAASQLRRAAGAYRRMASHVIVAGVSVCRDIDFKDKVVESIAAVFILKAEALIQQADIIEEMING